MLTLNIISLRCDNKFALRVMPFAQDKYNISANLTQLGTQGLKKHIATLCLFSFFAEGFRGRPISTFPH